MGELLHLLALCYQAQMVARFIRLLATIRWRLIRHPAVEGLDPGHGLEAQLVCSNQHPLCL